MTLDAEARKEPGSTLQDMEVHSTWMRHFRSGENAPFYQLAFDFIAGQFGPPDGRTVVDAGCGSGTKTLELLRRGFRVHAMDFSAAILDEARHEIEQAGFAGRVEFSREDLTALTLRDASVDLAVCWGVLMHVPDVTSAVSELSRVMAPGGRLIVSEGNRRAAQAVALRSLKRMLGRERAEVNHTPAGIEFWEQTSTTRLMTRQADIDWLIAEFARNGMDLVDRRAGQFTEVYVLVPWRPIRKAIHAFNNAWFRRFRWAGPAFGNLLTFERRRTPAAV